MRPIPPIEDLRTYPKRYVTPAQLALYVNITRRTIYTHMGKGALPYVKIGGVIRIRIEDAREYAGESKPLAASINPHSRPSISV